MRIDIAKLHHSRLQEAMDLVWETFVEFEAPEYPEEGILTFHNFICNERELERLEIFGAEIGGVVVGVLAMRGDHISLFFVKEEVQNQGIGRALWEYFLGQCQAGKITVNSSPYAVPIYERLGFQAVDEEQLTDGIRYTPMTLIISQ